MLLSPSGLRVLPAGGASTASVSELPGRGDRASATPGSHLAVLAGLPLPRRGEREDTAARFEPNAIAVHGRGARSGSERSGACR